MKVLERFSSRAIFLSPFFFFVPKKTKKLEDWLCVCVCVSLGLENWSWFLVFVFGLVLVRLWTKVLCCMCGIASPKAGRAVHVGAPILERCSFMKMIVCSLRYQSDGFRSILFLFVLKWWGLGGRLNWDSECADLADEQTIKYASPASTRAQCVDRDCNFQHQW
jgi:hypothetical protein